MILKAKDALSPYFRNVWNICDEIEYEVELVDAKQFLREERIDLICKLVYIK